MSLSISTATTRAELQAMKTERVQAIRAIEDEIDQLQARITELELDERADRALDRLGDLTPEQRARMKTVLVDGVPADANADAYLRGG